VNPHLQELQVAHNVGAHGRSGHHSGRSRVEQHHADLAKEVVRLQGASVGAAHGHVHLTVREEEEGMVTHSLGDECGACWNPDFVHLSGKELEVNAGEAREERDLSEVVDSGRDRFVRHIECIVPYALLVRSGGGAARAPLVVSRALSNELVTLPW
jgi:hypothetical protein